MFVFLLGVYFMLYVVIFDGCVKNFALIRLLLVVFFIIFLYDFVVTNRFFCVVKFLCEKGFF